jgi:hypothetical protein
MASNDQGRRDYTMRTIILVSVAAGSLLLTGHATSAERPVSTAQSQVTLEQSTFYHGGPLDYRVGTPDDARVYTGYPDRIPSEVDYRSGDNYDTEGRWTGTWNGTYETPEGRQYQGTYEGTYEGRAGTSYPPPPGYYQNGYDPRYDAEMDRRCGKSGGTTGGAVIGGLVGGVAGNRIAGKGNRTGGTLIGAGVGALAGAAIGSASDRNSCDEYYARRDSYAYNGAYPYGGYYGAGGTTFYQQGGYGYGYGYYSPGVVVTTTISGAPVVTETVETTTTTRYVNVPTRKRYVAKKRKWRPKAKPRCAC